MNVVGFTADDVRGHPRALLEFDDRDHVGNAIGERGVGGSSCDLRFATPASVFGLTEVTRGIIAGGGGTQRLPRMIPLAAAMEILLTGRHVTSDEALRWGLINRVVPPDELMHTAREVANAIASNAPLAVRATKEATLRGLDVGFEDGMRIEAFLSQIIARTEDSREGPLAFAEKRKPDYKGR